MAENRSATQIISGAGEFDASAMEHFINSVTVYRPNYGLSYAVVAIIGPQSSGKSTLLNYLFGTDFKEMKAIEGRSQTTTGIWMAKAVGVDPLTLVMDLEGSDSRVREEDTTFEKRSALFALAMADIVIINIWCVDIGLQNAACRPLLKIVFEVNMRLFASKKMLLFVIRDKTKTPIEKLEHDIKEDIKKIWEGLPKPDAFKATPLSGIFNVEVIALASYAYQEELFEKDVAKLGQWLFNPTTLEREVLAGDGRNAVPLTDFCWKADLIWKKIKENKDIDIPALSILVANMRCKEIANEKLSQFKSDEEWMAMDVDPGAISGFGKRASSILKRYFKKYDDECKNYDGGVRTTTKREYLEEKALELVFCCYKKLLEHLRSVSCRNFKNHLEDLLRRGEGFAAAARTCLQEFDQRCSDGAIEQANWEEYYKKVRYELLRDIVEELKDKYKKKLSNAIKTQVKTLFDNSGPQTWASIRKLLGRENDAAGSGFSSAVAGVELERAEVAKMLLDLKAYATNLVEKISRERAKEALQHMMERFSISFVVALALAHLNRSKKGKQAGMNRSKKERQDAMEAASLESLKLLSIMAVMRLDNEETTDNVEDVLFKALMSGNAVSEDRLLDSDTWDDVPPEKTLITPIQCKALWKEFIEKADRNISKALRINEKMEEDNKKKEGKKHRFWFIFLTLSLGVTKCLMVVTSSHGFLLPLAIAELCIGGLTVMHKEGLLDEAYDFIDRQIKKGLNYMEELKKRWIEFYEYLKSLCKQVFGSEKKCKNETYEHENYQPLLTM